MVQPSTSRARSARSKSQPKSKPKRPSLTVKIPIPPRARRARSSTVASSGASTDDSDMPRTPSPITPLPNLPEVVVSNTPEKLGGVGDGLVSGVDALGLDFDVCLPPPPSSPKGPVCYEKMVRWLCLTIANGSARCSCSQATSTTTPSGRSCTRPS